MVVFPKPAGAATTVSAARDTAPSRCTSRGLTTASGIRSGTRYLLDRSVATTAVPTDLWTAAGADCRSCRPPDPPELPSPAVRAPLLRKSENGQGRRNGRATPKPGHRARAAPCPKTLRAIHPRASPSLLGGRPDPARAVAVGVPRAATPDNP